MALEDLLTKLIGSLDRNSAAMEALNTKAGGAAPKATGGAAATAPKAGAAAGKGKAKELTVDDVAAAFGRYMKAGDDDDKAIARANVKIVLEHFGAERATLMAAKHYADAIDAIKTLEAGELPDFFPDADGGGDAADDLM